MHTVVGFHMGIVDPTLGHFRASRSPHPLSYIIKINHVFRFVYLEGGLVVGMRVSPIDLQIKTSGVSVV